MNAAELQRILLLVALGICGFLLVKTWIADEELRRASESRQTPVTAPLDTERADRTGAEDAIDVPASANQDVPDQTFIDSATTTTADAYSEYETAANRLITVATPRLQLWIDPIGGDIVGAKLPQYPVSLKEPHIPMTILDRGGGRVYIAQSGLAGQDGFDSGTERPLYSARRQDWIIEEGVERVVLSYEDDYFTVQKVFEFDAGSYLVDVSYRVTNETSQDLRTNFFAQLKRDSGEAFNSEGGFFRPPAYVGAALTTEDSRYEKVDFDDVESEDYRQVVRGGWIAFLQHYFLSTWIAPDEAEYTYYARRDSRGIYRFGFIGPAQAIRSGATETFRAKFYVGPKTQSELSTISENLHLTVDYGLLWWLSVPLFKIMSWFQSYVGNWGVAIILLTLLIKTVFFPLSAISYRSMAKMRKVQPQMKRLQERHAGDRQKLGQEMMALYAREKANPLAGCLVMLIQMPFFLALYWVLNESVELRQQPFMLWIQDLSAIDPWFVLPILNGLAMYFMQKLNPPMPDPMQQRVFAMMPIMFGLISVFVPSGLVLYWLVNTIYSFAHHWYALHRSGAAPSLSKPKQGS